MVHTVLQRLGGPDALLKIVEIFYNLVIQDNRLSPMFDGVGMFVSCCLHCAGRNSI